MAARALPHGRYGGLWIDRIQRFVEGASLPLPERYQRYLCAFTESEKTSLFSSDFIAQLFKSEGGETELAMNRVEPCSDLLERILLTDMETYLPDDELRKADRLSMWHSLEVRVPFLDHKLVEFVATIPSGLKLKGWEKKHILVQCLRGIVPDSILNRRKQGFSIPLAAWLRGPLRELLRAYLSKQTLYDVGIFNVMAVEAMMNDHDRNTRNYETQLWAVLAFVVWHRRYMNAH